MQYGITPQRTRLFFAKNHRHELLRGKKIKPIRETGAMMSMSGESGNVNPDCSHRSGGQVSPAGDEVLESLSFSGGWKVRGLSDFLFIKATTERHPVTGRLLEHCRLLMTQKPGKGDALRKEQALLHTFVAGQKYGVWRDAPRRFCLSKKTRATDSQPVAPSFIETPHAR
jgi:hypothetical protein